MLLGDDELSSLMFNGIKEQFLIEKVIIEESGSKIKLLLRRIKRLGVFVVFGQVIFLLYTFYLRINSKKRIDEIKTQHALLDSPIDESIVTRVTSINCEETLNLLRQYKPDVVIVNGTSIIKKKILETFKIPFINTHMGITPKYRGVHGGYWALASNDDKHCGVTIHMVDAGIDTGGVLNQKTISITKDDTFITYPYLQLSMAIPLMAKTISQVTSNKYTFKKNDLPSKLWSHPTIFQYIKYRKLYGVK